MHIGLLGSPSLPRSLDTPRIKVTQKGLVFSRNVPVLTSMQDVVIIWEQPIETVASYQ